MKRATIKDDINLENYFDVLKMLESSDSHLLLGNGFNCSLGIKTDYHTIFEEMKKEYAGYIQLDNLFNKDIEKLIGKLSERIKKGGEYDKFIEEYINNKIKHDFMKAATEIVKKEIKKIYKKKTESIYLLLIKFTNYFTLNYDPCLYLLLMKFKKNDEVIAFQYDPLFIQQDLDTQHDHIFTIVKNAYDRGHIETTIDGQSDDVKMSYLKKKEFEQAITRYYEEKKWPKKILIKVVDRLWKEKQGNPGGVEVNDNLLPEFFPERAQNLFFLHGAFHIHHKDGKEFKITQTKYSALYDKLWETIQDKNRDIICILKSTSKLSEIKKSRYLTKCYEKLGEIEGYLVIIGSSLSGNDEHIFTKINENIKIKTIFYSSSKKSKIKDNERLKELFPHKKITLFDRDTVSYKSGQYLK